jgi:hypothetical protein
MDKLVVDSFELNKEQINLLLTELKDERVQSAKELERYLKDHSYVKDNSRRYHLLVAKHPKKRSFAIPFSD